MRPPARNGRPAAPAPRAASRGSGTRRGSSGAAAARRFDVFGRDGRPHEDEVVVEIVPVQDLGRHRVEEGLGQLGLAVAGQQADVVQLDLLPDCHRQRAGVKVAPQPLDRFLDPAREEREAFALRLVLAVPVASLEACACAGAGLPEQLVVAVESLQHRAGDVEGAGVVELLREHRRVSLRPGQSEAASAVEAGAKRCFSASSARS